MTLNHGDYQDVESDEVVKNFIYNTRKKDEAIAAIESKDYGLVLGYVSHDHKNWDKGSEDLVKVEFWAIAQYAHVIIYSEMAGHDVDKDGNRMKQYQDKLETLNNGLIPLKMRVIAVMTAMPKNEGRQYVIKLLKPEKMLQEHDIWHIK
jgi:hypothetical protein